MPEIHLMILPGIYRGLVDWRMMTQSHSTPVTGSMTGKQALSGNVDDEEKIGTVLHGWSLHAGKSESMFMSYELVNYQSYLCSRHLPKS